MKFQFPVKRLSLITAAIFSVIVASAQTSKDKKIIADADEARATFIRTDGLLANLFNNSFAYVIFPNVGKGGIGVGGAAGNGAVYKNGAVIGMAKMTQVTIGFQFGGQAYQEVIFFENEDALN